MSGEERQQTRARIVVPLTILGLLLIAGGYLTWQAASAASALREADVHADRLATALAEGDTEAAQQSLLDLQESTSRASARTSGALWPLARNLPVLGDDARALSVLAQVSDEVAQFGLPPLVDSAQAVNADRFTPRNGEVDLGAIAAIAPALAESATVFTAADQTLTGVETGTLTSALRTRIEPLHTRLAQSAHAVEIAADAARLLPEMLGDQTPRRYLLVSQNNAEIRSTGGLPGAWSLVEAEQGRVRIVDQGTGRDISPFDAAENIQISAEEEALFTTRVRRDFRNANLVPHFPRAAELISAMADTTLGIKLDGVIALDPIALSYVLAGTGPITMPDGLSLTADNAVEELLHRVYLRFDDPGEQDAYFEDASRIAFDTLASGQGDAHSVLAGLVRGASEGRVLMWSRHPAEQRILGARTIGGSVVTDETTSPNLGIFLNDGSSGKMQYFLRSTTQITGNRCHDDESQTFDWAMRLSSTLPADHDFPFWIVGDRFGDRPPGSQLVTFRIYAPPGGATEELRLDEALVGTQEQRHLGREVQHLSVWLEPEQSVVVSGRTTSGAAQPGAVELVTTPGVTPGPNRLSAPSAC